jgi:DoxX.
MTDTAVSRPSIIHRLVSDKPSSRAFMLLRTVFTIAPIAFGLDKFFNILTDWPQYLPHVVTDIVPMTGQQFMYIVGVIEIIAGIAVAVRPRFGSLLVSVWLAIIIVNLLLIPGYFDVALRDFGLLVAALSLFLLSLENSPHAGVRRIQR